MAAFQSRIARYAALTAAIPAAAAHAESIGYNGAPIVIAPGEGAFIDFGAVFGEVFRFELRTQDPYGYSVDRSVSPDYFNAFFQFNPDNAGGVGAAAFIGYSSASGGIGNDPARLGSGAVVSSLAAFAGPMTTTFSTSHDIANRGATTSSGFGDWLPDARGFIGFRMLKDGSFHYGWFDVETRNWASANRQALPELVIHGWALNTEPGVAIDTGDIPAPAAGGLLALAMGAAGLRRARQGVLETV